MLQIVFTPYFWFILMFQLPVPGSCCILKLSRDIPKLPRIEFPNSFSFPKASSLSLDIFSSYNICSFRLKYVMTAVKWKCACDRSGQKRTLTSFHLSSDRKGHCPVPIWHLQKTCKHVQTLLNEAIKGSKDIVERTCKRFLVFLEFLIRKHSPCQHLYVVGLELQRGGAIFDD